MFGPPLDSLTLLLAISALGFVMAAISWNAAKAMPADRRALRAWSRSMLAAGAGFFLFHLRGHTPLFLSSVVGNALVITTAAYGLAAHSRLLGVRIPRWAYAVACAIGLAGAVATYALGAPQTLTVSTVSASLALLFGGSALLLARSAWTRRHLLTAVSAAVMSSMSAALVLRVFIAAFGEPAQVSIGSTASPQIGLFLLGIVYVLTGSLWVFDTVHERQRTAAVETARRDGLTGLYTRTAFFELACQLLERQRSASCAVVMADIDHFKRINDTLGHAAGDMTLAHAARLISNSVRLYDVVGRYGGEEFCILLPGCDAAAAAELAERLVTDAARQSVRLQDGRTTRYTLSAGYVSTALPARVGQPMDVLSRLMERADQALYTAKRQGRNRALAAAGTSATDTVAA